MPTNPLRDAINAHVARLLKERRVERGLSLNSLAEKSGLSRQTISCVEQEVQSPSLDTLLRITGAIGVKLEDIIGQARATAFARGKPRKN